MESILLGIFSYGLAVIATRGAVLVDDIIATMIVVGAVLMM